MVPFKFSETARAECPTNSMTDLIERADSERPLDMNEENELARLMYGPVGFGAIYKHFGWAWNIAEARQMRRWLVQVGQQSFRVMLAPHWNSLVNVLTEGGDYQPEDILIVPFNPVHPPEEVAS